MQNLKGKKRWQIPTTLGIIIYRTRRNECKFKNNIRQKLPMKIQPFDLADFDVFISYLNEQLAENGAGYCIQKR